MGNIIRIYKKEVGEYLGSPPAYIFLIIFLIIGASMFFFTSKFFTNNQASLAGLFIFMPWLLLFFVPAIAMRIWAEEKKAGTDELLMTLPVRDFEIVIGKYLAALTLIVLGLVLTFPLPMIVQHFADPKTPVDWGPIMCGYFAAAMFGATVLAIGTWASSMTVNQIIAFIIGIAITFLIFLLGYPFIYNALPNGDLVSKFSPYTHYVSMYRGVIDTSDIVYFLSAVVFFLFLNTRSVESRRWK